MAQRSDRLDEPKKKDSAASSLTPIFSPTEDDAFVAFSTLVAAAGERSKERYFSFIDSSPLHRLRRRDADRAERNMWTVIDYLESLPRTQRDQVIRNFIGDAFPDKPVHEVLNDFRAWLTVFGENIEQRWGPTWTRMMEKPVLPPGWAPRTPKGVNS
jgi:hypothetical protein